MYFHLQSPLGTSIIVKYTFFVWSSRLCRIITAMLPIPINLETYLLPSLLPAAAGAFLQDFTLIFFTLLLFPPGPRYVLWNGHSHFTFSCCFDGSFKTNWARRTSWGLQRCCSCKRVSLNIEEWRIPLVTISSYSSSSVTYKYCNRPLKRHNSRKAF